MDGQQLYAGIDPGAMGGLAVVDRRGAYYLSVRWDRRDPASLYRRLSMLRPRLGMVYMERVRVFREDGIARALQTQQLLVNAGIWQGWLIALETDYRLIDPQSWQAATGLSRWRSRHQANPLSPTPLSLARRIWPEAQLDAQADDGRAVALILADLARRDALLGYRRGSPQTLAKTTKTTRRAPRGQTQRPQGRNHAR